MLVIAYQERSLERRRGRLCKGLNMFMPGALRTGVSQFPRMFLGNLLNITLSDLHPGNVVFAIQHNEIYPIRTLSRPLESRELLA